MDTKLELTDRSSTENVIQLTSALRKLKPVDRLSVKSKSNFTAVMKAFQSQNWGYFDWLPLHINGADWSGYLVPKSGGFKGIFQIMKSHHKHCDNTYVIAENTLDEGDRERGTELMQSFIWNMDLHLTREEAVLFPAFEKKTGMVKAPTEVMRTEHKQIKELLMEIADCLSDGNFQRMFDISETLLILTAQHNAKEETVFYPMTDQHLAADAEPIAKQLQLLTL